MINAANVPISLNVTVGAPGVGAISSHGQNVLGELGGTSSFGDLVSFSSSSLSAAYRAGNGGGGARPQVGAPGTAGFPSKLAGKGGDGGSSESDRGQDGAAPGGGGGGGAAAKTDSGNGGPGGNGGRGEVRVWGIA